MAFCPCRSARPRQHLDGGGGRPRDLPDHRPGAGDHRWARRDVEPAGGLRRAAHRRGDRCAGSDHGLQLAVAQHQRPRGDAGRPDCQPGTGRAQPRLLHDGRLHRHRHRAPVRRLPQQFPWETEEEADPGTRRRIPRLFILDLLRLGRLRTHGPARWYPNATCPAIFSATFRPGLRRLFNILLRSPAPWRQDGENGRKMA